MAAVQASPGHHALGVDASGAWSSSGTCAATSGGLQSIAARSSTNRGATWSARVTLPATGDRRPATGAQATALDVESTGSGVDVWNVCNRSSTNGSGAAYTSATGFLEPYGDLRRDGHHLGRQDDRRLGRGHELHGRGQALVQPPSLTAHRNPEVAGRDLAEGALELRASDGRPVSRLHPRALPAAA